jgi:hypothetical protein
MSLIRILVRERLRGNEFWLEQVELEVKVAQWNCSVGNEGNRPCLKWERI